MLLLREGRHQGRRTFAQCPTELPNVQEKVLNLFPLEINLIPTLLGYTDDDSSIAVD